METTQSGSEHKVLVGFKCSPSFRSTLCTQADKLGVTLSSYVETLVLTQEHNLKQIESLSEQVNALNKEISGYKSSLQKMEAQLSKDREVAQKTTSKFIVEVTKGHKEKATQLIQTYNNILNDERRNNL
jgi:septal ring factor EnvC (AmiA/AmiB activator)